MMVHEVAAVACLRGARRGRDDLSRIAKDGHGDADFCSGHGAHFPVYRAAHRRPRRQILRSREHGHAVRHRHALAPSRRLPQRMARRESVHPITGSYDTIWMIDIALAIGAALIHMPIKEAPLALKVQAA